MLRYRRFLGVMHRLALLGALLVAVAPAISRWMQADGVAFQPHLAALCTGQGMKLVDLDRLIGGAMASPAGHAVGLDRGEGLPMPAGHDGAACDYCLLGAHLMPWVLALLVLPLLRVVVGRRDWALILPRTAVAWPAHAARGPPRFSVA